MNQPPTPLTFQPFRAFPPGTVVDLLIRAYAGMAAYDPAFVVRETAVWAAYDREVYANLDTVGACGLVSLAEGRPIGFVSWDPRQRPTVVIGHSCIVPEFTGRRYGTAQLSEALRLLRERGFQRAVVSTGDHPFFIPAQRMYVACGFREVGREMGRSLPMVCYEMEL